MIEHVGDIANRVDFSTKKKNQKENISKALSLKERKDRVARVDTNRNSEMGQNSDDSQKESPRQRQTRINARRNSEIDEYLLRLLMENMIDESYWKFHTKCVHTLGLDKYNQLVIESRDGKKPKHLLAFKLKGALELHYKRKLYREKYNLSE